MVRKPSGTDQSAGQASRACSGRCREARHGRGHGDERGAAADQHPGGRARRGQPRHQMPRTSNGQKEDGGHGEGEPDGVGDGQPADEHARDERYGHGQHRAEPEVPYPARWAARPG